MRKMSAPNAAQKSADAATRPTRAEDAYEQIRSEILRGNLVPGSRLKIEDLQGTYGYSNTPLREALNKLSGEGLVRSDGRRGFRVSPVSASDFRDLCRFREVLETTAIQAAIENGDDDWESEVIAAHHRLEIVEREREKDRHAHSELWTDRHKMFHFALISACGSDRHIAAWSEMFDQAERYRRISASDREKPRDARNEHSELARLALARDMAAVELMRVHVVRTEDNVMRILEANGGLGSAERD